MQSLEIFLIFVQPFLHDDNDDNDNTYLFFLKIGVDQGCFSILQREALFWQGQLKNMTPSKGRL